MCALYQKEHIVASCRLQGTYTPANGAAKTDLLTNQAGRFQVDSPVLAHYNFTSNGPTFCVDAVSRSRLTFPHTLVLPPLANATITAISLLTVPARSDAAMQALFGSMAAAVPEQLWAQVYGMFGYPIDSKQVRWWADHGERCVFLQCPGNWQQQQRTAALRQPATIVFCSGVQGNNAGSRTAVNSIWLVLGGLASCAS